jgi:hypothetical protein
MMRSFILAGALLSMPFVATRAQFPVDVQPGTRVRVWLPEPTRQEQSPEHRMVVRGTVESVNGDALRVAIPGTQGSLTIPRTSVRRLDVSKGVSRAASGFERMVEGAVVGAIYAALMNDPGRRNGPSFRTDWEAAGVGAGIGAGAGLFVGVVAPYERWRRVLRVP